MSTAERWAGISRRIKEFGQKIQQFDEFGLFIPALALATAVYYHFAWIFLTYTNSLAQRTLPDAFYFTQTVFRPEPHEVPAYFVGYLIIPLLAFVFTYVGYWLLKKNYVTAGFIKKWPLALLLGVLGFLFYKIFLHLFWFDLWRQILPKGDLKLQGLLALSLLAALFCYRNRYDFSFFLERFERLPWQKLRPVLFLVLAIFIFSPNFPFDHHHYNDLLGPVNDLLGGKYFLNETTSPYGFLNTYFLYWVFQIIPISYQGFSLLLAVTLLVWHVSWYYLIRNWLRSEVLAAGAVLAMAIFLSAPQINFDLFYNAPSNTPFHQLAFLFVAFLWWRFATQEHTRKRQENYVLVATAVGFFWFVDTGIYLVLATMGVFFFWNLFQNKTLLQKFRAFVWQGLKLLLWILAIGMLYSLWQYGKTGVLPNWPLLYSAALFYRQGYMMIPLPSHGFYYAYIFVFTISLVYIFWQGFLRVRPDKFVLPLFIVLFGILQLTYYITRSHSLNLAPRDAVFLILLVVWWYRITVSLYRNRQEAYYTFSGLLVGAVLFTALYGGYKFFHTVQARDYAAIRENYVAETIGQPGVYEGNADILDDIAALKKDYPDMRRVPLIHWYDAKILLDLNKTNYFSIFNFPSIFFKSEVGAFIEKTRKEKPLYLFVGRKDSDGFGPFSVYADKLDYFLAGVGDLYHQERQMKTMNVWRLNQ